MRTATFKLSVLLLREGDAWVAQCLEYDIAAQGKTIHDAKDAFARTFSSQVVVDLHHGNDPLQGFTQAPKEYSALFDRAEPFTISLNDSSL